VLGRQRCSQTIQNPTRAHYTVFCLEILSRFAGFRATFTPGAEMADKPKTLAVAGFERI